MQTAVKVLREFVADIEAVGTEFTQRDWPDLMETYRHAKEALANPPAATKGWREQFDQLRDSMDSMEMALWEPRKVIVTCSGGVLGLKEASPDVEVVFRDYDVEGCGDELTRDEDGDEMREWVEHEAEKGAQ